MESLLTVVGINHQTSAVSAREALAPRMEESGQINETARRQAGLADAVVLATCSRFEIYANLKDCSVSRMKDYLSRRAGRSLADELYMHRGLDAVRHIFRVSAGLDSWVIGESEILGQVKSAYQQACREATVTKPLHLSFQRALFIGKKVRSETSIVGGINSIGGAAALLARRIFTKLENQRVMVFGAGAMASSTVRHLRSKGAGQLWVANRSAQRAQSLALELGGIALDIEEGLRRLPQVDVAIFSTGASDFIFTEADAREVSRQRLGRPIFIIDLGLPRNVDPGAARANGVFVYDMDDLRRLVDESLRRRESDLARAEAIVAAESVDCWSRIANPEDSQGAPAGRRRCPLRPEVASLRAA